jgi:hypothetical protein
MLTSLRRVSRSHQSGFSALLQSALLQPSASRRVTANVEPSGLSDEEIKRNEKKASLHRTLSLLDHVGVFSRPQARCDGGSRGDITSDTASHDRGSSTGTIGHCASDSNRSNSQGGLNNASEAVVLASSSYKDGGGFPMRHSMKQLQPALDIEMDESVLQRSAAVKRTSTHADAVIGQEATPSGSRSSVLDCSFPNRLYARAPSEHRKAEPRPSTGSVICHTTPSASRSASGADELSQAQEAEQPREPADMSSEPVHDRCSAAEHESPEAKDISIEGALHA